MSMQPGMRAFRSGGVAALRFQHARQWDLETGKKRRRKHIAGIGRKLDDAGEAVALAAIDANRVDLGIDHPVFGDACSFVQSTLDRLIPLSGAW
jgi:hypothetical protein